VLHRVSRAGCRSSLALAATDSVDMCRRYLPQTQIITANLRSATVGIIFFQSRIQGDVLPDLAIQDYCLALGPTANLNMCHLFTGAQAVAAPTWSAKMGCALPAAPGGSTTRTCPVRPPTSASERMDIYCFDVLCSVW
jgi:hypothetical protein